MFSSHREEISTDGRVYKAHDFDTRKMGLQLGYYNAYIQLRYS